MDDIDVYFATFAKSMASTGAFIAGDKEIMDYMKYNMRSQVFAKSLQMVLVKGALKRLDMLRTMPELKSKLWQNVDALQNGLRKSGFDIGTTQSCVTPVYLKGSIPEAMVLVKDLRENYGIFCSIVVYPVIPKGLIQNHNTLRKIIQEADIELKANAIRKGANAILGYNLELTNAYLERTNYVIVSVTGTAVETG